MDAPRPDQPAVTATGRLRAVIRAHADGLAAQGHQPIPVRDGRIEMVDAARAHTQLATSALLRAIVDHPCTSSGTPR